MAINLLDAVQGLITPDLTRTAASRMGEPEGAVSKGLMAALPLLHGALLPKLNDSSTMTQIMALLTNHANNSGVLSNPASVLAGDPSATGRGSTFQCGWA